MCVAHAPLIFYHFIFWGVITSEPCAARCQRCWSSLSYRVLILFFFAFFFFFQQCSVRATLQNTHRKRKAEGSNRLYAGCGKGADPQRGGGAHPESKDKSRWMEAVIISGWLKLAQAVRGSRYRCLMVTDFCVLPPRVVVSVYGVRDSASFPVAALLLRRLNYALLRAVRAHHLAAPKDEGIAVAPKMRGSRSLRGFSMAAGSKRACRRVCLLAAPPTFLFVTDIIAISAFPPEWSGDLSAQGALEGSAGPPGRRAAAGVARSVRAAHRVC